MRQQRLNIDVVRVVGLAHVAHGTHHDEQVPEKLLHLHAPVGAHGVFDHQRMELENLLQQRHLVGTFVSMSTRGSCPARARAGQCRTRRGRA